MAAKLVENIRKRTREEYEELVRERFTALRIWIQEHPERASIISLIAGIIFVLLFKLVMWIFMVLLAIAFSIWYIACPAGAKSPQSKPTNKDSKE